MARKIVKPKKNKPIRSLKIDGHLWGGYRGNPNIVWNATYKDNGFLVEEFATVCKCKRWYGWIDNIDRAERLHKQFKKQGCSKCKGKRK